MTQTVSLCLPSIREADGSYFIAVKGAPDQLLKRVTRIEVNGEVRPITDEDKKAILATNKDLAKQALRVLMMAYKTNENSNLGI